MRLPVQINPQTALMGMTGLVVLFALEAAAPRLTSWAEARSTSNARAGHVLVLSDQARRFLLLQYRAYPTEFMGCMVGAVRGNEVLVRRIAPADVDPAESKATHVVPKTTCEAAGWPHPAPRWPRPINSHSCASPIRWMPSCAGTRWFGSTVTARSARSRWPRHDPGKRAERERRLRTCQFTRVGSRSALLPDSSRSWERPCSTRSSSPSNAATHCRRER